MKKIITFHNYHEGLIFLDDRTPLLGDGATPIPGLSCDVTADEIAIRYADDVHTVKVLIRSGMEPSLSRGTFVIPVAHAPSLLVALAAMVPRFFPALRHAAVEDVLASLHTDVANLLGNFPWAPMPVFEFDFTLTDI